MIDLTEIERAVEATNVGAILVPARILRRVIKKHRNLAGVGLDVPHAFAYTLPRAALLPFVEENEMGRSADRLPESVILLPRPEDATDAREVLISLWRATFHACVHREIEGRLADGSLSRAAILARIHRIGQTEFDEIRFVLKQDDLLLPPHDDSGTYAEFAATYLELRTFAPEALHRTFPALGDLPTIDATLALDIDAESLVAQCRPAIAPTLAELAASRAARMVEAPVRAPRLRAHSVPGVVSPAADRARARGNAVRSILLRVRTQGTESEVRSEMVDFMARVATALKWPEAPVQIWAETVLAIVNAAPSAARMPWNTEARLLYDLQMSCVDHEREIYTVGVVEWALSGGKRPIKRPLPAQREVRIVKHMRAARDKLPQTRIDLAARTAISALFREWIERAEGNLRVALRPRIRAALEVVGLTAENVPERVASKKLVEELCDQVTAHGFMSLSQLRDALSRNGLKMKNLRLGELARGDALLKVDRVLAITLDGVYRKGEIYLRGLQKISSITFGTRLGRILTLYLMLPIICAYVAIEGVHHMVGPLLAWAFDLDVHFLTPLTLGSLSVALFILIHSAMARSLALRALRVFGQVLRFVFLTMPGWFFRTRLVRALLRSRPVVLLNRFFVRPLLFTAVGLLIVPIFGLGWIPAGIVAVALFIVWNVILNSKAGALLEEAAVDQATRRWRQLRKRVLPGLVAVIADAFRRMLEWMERAIYAVDELLRFREGDGSFSLYVKGTLGVIWFFVAYLVRVYVNLFIEPEVNPIKHFPVVTVAAKIMIPVTPPIHHAMSDPLTKVFGGFIAESIAAPTVFFMPGFFGFLVWELKENWRLYKMNRAPALEPVLIGSHGETMVAFMKPGLHSGTVPKLYAKLRRAAWKGERSVLRHQEALHHVEEALHHFAEREIIALLGESGMWTGGPLRVGHIDIASNRVRIEIVCDAIAREGVIIAFEEQSGWLLGGIARPGFVDSLSIGQRAVFENALAGFYKIAGVELVHEQVAACLGHGVPYDISEGKLIVWPDGANGIEVAYDLEARSKLHARVRSAPPGGPRTGAKVRDLPPIEARLIRFRDQKILWVNWVDAWSRGTSVEPPRLTLGPSLLPSPNRLNNRGDEAFARAGE